MDFLIFPESDREHDQNSNNDTFCRLPIVSAQCIIGIEKYLDSAMLLRYNDDDYSQGYGQTEEYFKALTEDDLLQPYISEHDFRPSNDGNNIGYNIHVFDKRYQKIFDSAQPIKMYIKFSEINLAGIYGYALVLTSKLVSINSDGQRMFDLLEIYFFL